MSIISQLNTIQDIVDVSANVTNVVDTSSNITNIIQTNWKQVNDASFNLYNLFEYTYGNLNKLIYTSNYRGLQETNDQLYFEDEDNTSTDISYAITGLDISTNALNDSYKRITRFFTPNTGKSLYIISLTSDHKTTFTTEEILFEFGLENFDQDSTLKFQVNINSDGTSGYIKLQIVLLNASASPETPTRDISQNEFNIDIIDGTGISGFTYESRWHNQSFFILTDDNLSYIFGLSNGYKLIPVHSFNLAAEYEVFPIGGRTDAYRPFYSLTRNDSNGTSVSYCISNMSIFKDTELVYGTQNTIDSSRNDISINELPILSTRYFDVTKYRGNIQLYQLAIYTSKISRLKIYYGRNTDLTLTTPTWTQENNIAYDFSSNTFSGGTEIYSTLLKTEINIIDLISIIDYKLFGYDNDLSNSNIILFTIKNLESGTAFSTFDLSWFQF